MGFFNTLFQQATPAPIQERVTQPIPPGVPQSPAVQLPPGVPPQPQQYTPPISGPQQSPQGQPGSTPTSVVDQGKVNQWTALMDRIVQPDVLGPLQTFLAAASAPLEPGESLGARLGYASTLMNLHKSMLEENARLAPYLQKERDLKIQQMEAEIAQNQASTEASQTQTRRAKQQIEFDEKTEGQRIDLLKQQIREAQRRGDAAEAQRLKTELDIKLDTKYGARKAEADIAATEARARYLDRIPQTGAGAGKAPKNPKYANLSDAAFRQSYESTILNPYKRWAEEQKKQGLSYDWANYLAVSRNVREINEMMDEAMARGMQLEDRSLGVPGQTGPAPAMGKPGSLSNPIMRPKPGGVTTSTPKPSAFPPGLADRIPK